MTTWLNALGMRLRAKHAAPVALAVAVAGVVASTAPAAAFEAPPWGTPIVSSAAHESPAPFGANVIGRGVGGLHGSLTCGRGVSPDATSGSCGYRVERF